MPLEYSEEKYLVTLESDKGKVLFSKEFQSTYVSVYFNELKSPLQTEGKIIVQQISPLIGGGELATCHIKH